VSELLSWAITGLVAILVVTFALSVVSLRRVPLGERPETRTFDRFGRYLGRSENPDYHENPGEATSQEPDVERWNRGSGASPTTHAADRPRSVERTTGPD